MKVIKPGHIYELKVIDWDTPVTLKFVCREPALPSPLAPEWKGMHSGTQTQEVLRALIDRTIHCDNCLRWEGNDQIIFHLRMALVLHEARHLERMVEKGLPVELIETGSDGHFKLKRKEEWDEEPWNAHPQMLPQVIE